MVDIHCHILPEVDDGAQSWEIAAEMCRMAVDDGIEHIVATPHANSEFQYDRESHQRKLERLREMADGALQFSLGCEFHFSFENIQDLLKDPGRYCIGSTRYLLVEFNDFSVPLNTSELLQDLLQKNIVPIITHPERNPILQRKPELCLEWAGLGAVVQVTANSLTGRWGPVARSMVEFLAKNQCVHVLATDAHGIRSRPPILSEARAEISKLTNPKVADALVEENPRAIVSGEPLRYRDGQWSA